MKKEWKISLVKKKLKNRIPDVLALNVLLALFVLYVLLLLLVLILHVLLVLFAFALYWLVDNLKKYTLRAHLFDYLLTGITIRGGSYNASHRTRPLEPFGRCLWGFYRVCVGVKSIQCPCDIDQILKIVSFNNVIFTSTII